ncbi:hypothetical protein GCM10009785_23760 [Brooklawnia cerclae]|uniref:Urease accessory protein n=1 Tax=Brooklawnia cerclae TaxID=349934 RepID=A0ABX0SG40_9ACTN|nr:urease accessory protein [Brooklawnia cerclae]
MRTRIQVTPGPDRPQVELRGDVLAPRILATTPDGAEVAIVGTRMVLLAGDSVGIDVVVAPGGRLRIVEPVGTVAYGGPGSSQWDVSIELGAGAVLEWESQPFVVSDGADVTRTTRISLGADARLLQRETLVFGRSGQRGGSLVTRLDASGVDGPLLVEELDLRPDQRERVGILGDNRVLDSLLALGWRPGTPADLTAFELSEPGCLVRHVGHQHDHRPLDVCWFRWHGDL